MKTCIRCKIEKPFTEFHKDKHSKDSLNAYCRSCSSEKVKAWARNNPIKKLVAKKPYLKYRKDCCELCGFVPIHRCQLDVDHIDGNHSNNDESNLQTLCANCHRLKSWNERQS